MSIGKKILVSLIVVGVACSMTLPAAAKDFIYTPVTNALHIIDADSDTIVKTIPYNDYILTSQFSPDGKMFFMNAFHSIYAVDTAKQEIVDTFKFSTDLSRITILGFAVSEDSSKLFLSCSVTKKKQNIPKLNVLPPQLIVYDLKKKKMVKNYTIPYCVTGVITLRNDPNELILFGLDIFRFNLKDGKAKKIKGILNPEKGEEGKNALVIWHNNSPGDIGIFVNPYYTATRMGHFIVDRNKGTLEDFHVKDVWFEYSNIMTHDKKYIFSVMDELIKVDAKTGETVKAVPVKRGTCYGLSLTADGKKIYVGPAGADISVYDTETLELITVIPLDGDGIASQRISM